MKELKTKLSALKENESRESAHQQHHEAQPNELKNVNKYLRADVSVLCRQLSETTKRLVETESKLSQLESKLYALKQQRSIAEANPENIEEEKGIETNDQCRRQIFAGSLSYVVNRNRQKSETLNHGDESKEKENEVVVISISDDDSFNTPINIFRIL